MDEIPTEEHISPESAIKLAIGHALQAEALFRNAEKPVPDNIDRVEAEKSQEWFVHRALHHCSMARMWTVLGCALPQSLRPIPASTLDKMGEDTDRVVAEHELGDHNDFGEHPDCPKCQAAPA